MKKRSMTPRGDKRVQHDMCDMHFTSPANVSFQRMMQTIQPLLEIPRNDIKARIEEEKYIFYEKKMAKLRKIEKPSSSSAKDESIPASA
jgi:hypothetical protein